ncbi:FMN-dependent NADH-azoreductase [Curtobacterium sp. 24E2]|nr:NAD(P)H-dependent oxidoreductase [Curtobacterium sp. 24E2]
MPTLLHIDSSADLSHSRSRALTAAFADAWRARGPEYTVVRRDLHVDQLPHLETSALHWAAVDRTADESVAPEAEALRQEVIDELLAADVVVVGSPLYNYTVPSTLKAWIDRIHVPGVLAGDVQPWPAGRWSPWSAVARPTTPAPRPRTGTTARRSCTSSSARRSA